MSAGTPTPITRQLFTKYLWFSLLFLVHLPFIGLEYLRLWNLEHYQFFPFAVVAFGGLFYQRHLLVVAHWTRFNWALVSLDVLLLIGAVYLRSPFLAYAGAIALLWAACRAIPDAQFERSTGYLILLLLITLRLPQGLDLDAIHWLQRMTTSVASNVLNHFGFLHLRTGNVLEFPGKRFLVEEACSGVQSLFTLLFLAAFITCAYRRKLFHTLLVLVSAAFFAGVLNVLRVTAISIAWSSYQFDLSVGWQHEFIGHLALVIAAGLVYSADATIEFFCSPVPDISGAGINAVFENPLTRMWNWLFLVRTRTIADNGEVSAIEVPPETRMRVAEYDDDVQKREKPALTDLIRPRNLGSWAWNFIDSWFMSRDYRRLMVALPFLAVGLGGVFFVSWLRSAPKDSLVRNYETAAAEALKNDDAEAASVYLRGVVQLRPLSQRNRFQLAMHLIDQGQVAAATSHLQLLTGEDGYTPARLWLVNQASQPEPKVPLSADQIQQQLRAVLQRDPNNGFANQSLADFALRSGQFKLAEDYLLKAVESNPALSLPLAKVQRVLKRGDDQIAARLNVAEELFESRLLTNPADTTSRVQCAEILMLREQFADAERLLREGLNNDDSVTLKQSLAKLYSNLATRRLRDSVLNRELSNQLVVQAIALDPENRGILNQALSLTSIGATFTMSQLQPAIDSLSALETSSVEDQVLLAQLLATGGEAQAAADQIAPLVDEHPELRRTYAGFLKFAGRQEQSQALTNELLSELPEPNDVTSLQEICDRADLLFMASKYEAARTLLQHHSAAADDPPAQSRRRNVLYGRACLAIYDDGERKQALTPDSLELLDETIQTRSASMGVIERLVRLSDSDSELAAAADERLTRLLAAGNASAQVYNLVGTSALNYEDAAKARRYLERAYSLQRSDPMILNNLALALIRTKEGKKVSPSDAERALKLIDEALTIVPEHPDMLSSRGEILIAMKQWENARSDLELALPKRQKSANLRRMLIRVFEALDEPALAAEHSRQLAEVSDDSG